MQRRGLQGLRGLKGLNTLSPEERDAFMEANASKLDMYHSARNRNQAANILYMNQKYINTFGLNDFNLNNDGTEDSFNFRNKKTEFKLVTDAFKNIFGKDDNFNELATYLDVDGMYDLLNNQEYLTSGELKHKLASNIQTYKNNQRKYNNYQSGYYGQGAMGIGLMQMGEAVAPYEEDKKDRQRNKEILDKLKAESQKRREEEIQDDADIIYSNLLQADDSGKQSLARSLKDFEKIANAYGHYSQFKNSKWLRDYSEEDKLKDYSKYLALRQKYGSVVAQNYLERDIQNRVADAQDGKFTGNTLKGVLTTVWSDLGSNIALFANAKNMLDANRMAIVNQGKDPDQPIYDKKGNIIDYKDNDNIWTNPAYWNNVYKYNTFSPTNIKAIEEKGGISPDVNVRAYGYTPDFFSWDTVEEGFKQSGHVIAGIIETGLTGSIGKAVGLGGKAALKGLGLSAKAMQTASKVGAVTNDILVGATTGLEGSQLEAMGTFDDQLQSAKEKINAEIERDLANYQQSINYNSKEAKAGINAFYNQLKAKDNRRVALGNTREGAKAFPLSDATLKAQAKQLYTNQLLGAKQKELQEIHKKDEMEAARTATKAYMTNFLMDYVKNIPLTTAIQKFKIAKGSMRGAFDNTIDKNIIADAESGGVKRILDKKGNAIKFTSSKKLAKEIGKQFAGGFMDEYLDGINASFAGGVGNNVFDNYIRKNYDPKAYDSTMDSVLGNLVSGMSEGVDGLTDRENLYEGFIGMISPAATTTVNVNAIPHLKSTWNAVLSGKDESGNKINYAERVNKLLMNPLLNTYVEAKEKDRRVDDTVNAINTIISANKDKLNTAAKIVSVLDNYNTPLDGTNSMNILDSKDNKLYNAFTLINALNGLENIGGNKSQLYKDAMKTIQGLADGSLTKDEMDAEVDRFLADPDNKSILDESDKGKETAAKKLQENAKYFMHLKDRMDEISSLFASSPSLKNDSPAVKSFLMYNTVASEDYQRRLESIENELGLSHSDIDTPFIPDYNLRYGTDQAKKKAITAREREIAKLDDELEKLKNSNSYNEKKIKLWKGQSNIAYDDKVEAELKDKIKKSKTLIDSQKFQMKTLEEEKRKLQDEKDEIEKVETHKGITKLFLDNKDLVNYDVRDIAYVFDKDNQGNFSKGRKAVIDSIKASLEQKDPEAMRKIKDAATLANRIEDLKTTYNRINANSDLASRYFEAAEEARNRAAFGEAIQREIKERYGRLESAYLDREEHPESLKNEALNVHAETLASYMEDHPQQKDTLKPYYDMVKYGEDIASFMRLEDYPDDLRNNLARGLGLTQMASDNLKEWKNKLEELIDDPKTDPKIVNALENILSNMERVGYSRDATIIENRKQRLKREAEETKKREEEQKKKEEEAKKAAEKKVEESTDSSTQKNTEGVEVTGVPTNENLSKQSLEDVPWNVEENTTTNEAKSQPNTIDNEDLHQIPDGQWNAKKLLDDDYKGGAVDMGEMYYGSAENLKKGRFIVTRVDDNSDNEGRNTTETGDKITFSIDNNKESLYISPEDYETVTDEQKNKKNELFIADSLQKIDGDWYFNGTFANDKQQTQVKVSKNFDIDKAIEEQQEARKVALADISIMTNDKHILDEGDHVIVKSESIDEQMEGLPTTDREVHTSDVNEDVDNLNSLGEENIESSSTLSGNAMSRYKMEPLVSKGRIELKKGVKANDEMNKFYAWMKAERINLQNIIDHELARIIQNNPHAKVKFLVVNPKDNATHDNVMKNHLLLVLDYDNKINKGITGIHNDANGGVIDFNGKKYLTIGVAGYGANNPDMRVSWYRIWNRNTSESTPSPIRDLGLIIPERTKYLRKHPNDRFYVAEDYTTEIVPKSQIPGYIVRQGVNDEGTPYRSVKELLSDKERNPMNYRFEDLAWGIQELSQFLVVGTSLDNVMVPTNVAGNLGSAFVLMPASNGRMVPSYLKVLKYTEMNDGTLKNRINDLLQQVVAPDYQTRMKAAIELSTIFHMNKEGDFILLRKHKNEVSLTHDGKIEKTFVLDSNFDRGEFIRAFEDMNPRINITARVLGSQDLLNEYDEAGALQTDAAMFGTAGSSYSIYALDKDGKMIIPATPVNTVTTTDENSEWRNTNRRQLIFNQRYYTYSPDNADIFYLDGTMVTDDKKVSQLKRIRQILDGDFLPATSKDVWDYYVLDSSKKPVAIKVNRNTKEVKDPTEEQAKALIKKLAEEEAKRQREEAAQNSVKKESKVKFNDVEEVTLEGINDTGVTIDPNTGETITVDSETSGEAKPKEESTAVFGDYGNSKEEETKEITTAPKSKETMESSQAFNKIIGNKRYRLLLQKLIKNKWKDAPSDSKEWEKFLRDKNVEIDNIGSTKEEIETWIKTIEDCR